MSVRVWEPRKFRISVICKSTHRESGLGGSWGWLPYLEGLIYVPALTHPQFLSVFGMQNNLAPSSSTLSHGMAATSTGL